MKHNLELNIRLLLLCLLCGCAFCVPPIAAASSQSTIAIAIADASTAFTVMNPTGGSNVVECTSANADPSWVIDQWNNEKSLCQGATTNPTACPNATWVRTTTTMSDCYWRQTKKVQLAINTDAMSYNGCYLNRDQNHLQNPGGYDDYIATNTTKRSDFFTDTFPSLSRMSSLILSADFATNYFASSHCPTGVSDPLHGSTPYAFNYLSLILTQVLPGTYQGRNTLFYQVYMYDNRTSSPSHKNCTQTSGASPNGVALIGEPISVYGQPVARPGSALRAYTIDVLPRVEAGLTSCFGSGVDLSQYKVSGVYMGIEAANTAVMTVTVQNPQLRIVYSADSASTAPTPSPASKPAGQNGTSNSSGTSPSPTSSEGVPLNQPVTVRIRILQRGTSTPLAHVTAMLHIRQATKEQTETKTTDGNGYIDYGALSEGSSIQAVVLNGKQLNTIPITADGTYILYADTSARETLASAGVILGTGALVFTAIGIAVFCVVRRRRKREVSSPENPSPVTVGTFY